MLSPEERARVEATAKQQLGLSMRFIRAYDVKADQQPTQADIEAAALLRLSVNDGTFLRSIHISPE